MTTKSGQLDWGGIDIRPGGRDPRVMFAVPADPEWEVVLALSPSTSARLRSVTLQPAGTFRATAKNASPPEPTTDITSRLMRAIPIGAMTSIAVAEVHRHLERAATWADANGIEEWRRDRAMETSVREWRDALEARPGRRGRDDSFYLELAVAYTQRVSAGERSPIAALARERHLSASTVRNLIHESRRRGLLAGGHRGRSGGVLTSKALELIQEASDGER